MHGFFASSRIHKAAPTGLVPKCGVCGLFKRCHSPKMRPYGEGAKKVLILGEAPGESEDSKGRPFIGKAGQHLRSALGAIGVDMDDDALTTNALICRPPNNATPDAKQIGYCRPNLLSTIAQFKPRVIITLGRSALTAVLSDIWSRDVGPLERWVGWRIPLVGKYWICPTFHPSYLLRMHNEMLDRLFLEHLEAAFAIKKEVKPEPNWKELIQCELNEDRVVHALEKMDAEGNWLAVDYETTCIKPEWPRGKIVSCAVSDGKHTISYPWVGKNIEATGKLLRSKRTRKIASNLKMEQRWTIKEFGRGVRNWGWDTMLATHCLDNRPGICSLKFQSLVRLGIPEYNRHIEPYLEGHRGPYNRITEIDIKQLLFYGGMDAILEHRLARRQRKDLGYED